MFLNTIFFFFLLMGLVQNCVMLESFSVNSVNNFDLQCHHWISNFQLCRYFSRSEEQTWKKKRGTLLKTCLNFFPPFCIGSLFSSILAMVLVFYYFFLHTSQYVCLQTMYLRKVFFTYMKFGYIHRKKFGYNELNFFSPSWQNWSKNWGMAL